MTIERKNQMLEAISANEEADRKLNQLFDEKLNGWCDKWSVDELIEAVFNKFCK